MLGTSLFLCKDLSYHFRNIPGKVFGCGKRGGVLWRGSKEGGPSSKIFGWSGKDFFNFIFLDASPSQQTLPKNSQKNMFVLWICKPVETFVFRFFMALVIGLSTTSASLSCSNFILKNCNESSERKPSIVFSKSCHSTLICVFSCLIPAECFPIKKPGLRLFPGRDEGGGRGNWICQWKAWSWGLKNPFKSIYFPYRWHADWQKKNVIDCNISISSSDE